MVYSLNSTKLHTHLVLINGFLSCGSCDVWLIGYGGGLNEFCDCVFANAFVLFCAVLLCFDDAATSIDG